ncbi:MAG: NAD(P)/FAD-dependent oxidoreductase, partial [Bryobacteraceae bacterium]
MPRKTVDVIVAGAGIIGSSIAWRLAQAGLRVRLQDAGRMGGEASTAGAGMLAPGGELFDRSGAGALLLDSHRMYPRFVEELTEAAGIRIDYRVCGALEAALTEEEWNSLVLRAEAQRAAGIASEIAAHGDLPPALAKAGLHGALV